MIHIKAANNEEIDILLRLWIEKAQRLEAEGRPLWTVSQFTRENLKCQYDNPEYYICYNDDQVIGGFILIEFDREYWPERTNDQAFYLHKLMVCNNYNGKGYSKIILDWVKEFGSKKDKHYIRLDYESSRFGLKNLYTRNGFIEIQKWIDEGIEITKAEYRIN